MLSFHPRVEHALSVHGFRPSVIDGQITEAARTLIEYTKDMNALRHHFDMVRNMQDMLEGMADTQPTAADEYSAAVDKLRSHTDYVAYTMADLADAISSLQHRLNSLQDIARRYNQLSDERREAISDCTDDEAFYIGEPDNRPADVITQPLTQPLNVH